MKNIIFTFIVCLFFTSIQAQYVFYDGNDECSNPVNYGGFGARCSFIYGSTTIGTTFNNNTDIFSCDSSPLKSSVFFTFTTWVSEVEFNLHTGKNINVTVLKNYGENICNPGSSELTNNCFIGLNTTCNVEDFEGPEALFTNLMPMTNYLMAVWTDETQQTDFSFCLTRAPAYECDDGVCYNLAENAYSCPEDCPPIPSIPTIDECLNAKNIIANCDCDIEATTIRATHNSETDLFSCDDSSLKSTVFFSFSTRSNNIEFNLLEGENINVTLLGYVENECNPDSLELTENCFTNLNTRVDDLDAVEALFTNLQRDSIFFKEYILAIWTDETQQTDFKFCLREAPIIECGDSICYDLVENPDNCPQDCIKTGVEYQSTSFKIYPNPVIDELYINTNLNGLRKANVRIHSIGGKVMYHENLVRQSENYSLNISHLPEGMYCLQIYSNQINHLQKFLKID